MLPPPQHLDDRDRERQRLAGASTRLDCVALAALEGRQLSANARSASALCLPMTAYLARFAALGGGPSTRFLLVDGLPLCRFCEISLSAFFGLPAP